VETWKIENNFKENEIVWSLLLCQLCCDCHKKIFYEPAMETQLFEKLRFFCVMKNLCNPIKYVDINMNKEEQNTI